MKEWIAFVICAIYITIHQSNALNLIEVPKQYIRDIDTRAKLYKKYGMKPFKPLRPKQKSRRQGLDDANPKDDKMKEKIGYLIDQTINDAQKEFDSIEALRKEYNYTSEYKVGFLMYMVKRSRDVMNELFNVAVNHKDDWKALDQLKILELIIHTNVDSTNLLRRLVEIAVTRPTAVGEGEEHGPGGPGRGGAPMGPGLGGGPMGPGLGGGPMGPGAVDGLRYAVL